jgi:hypothetical protein
MFKKNLVLTLVIIAVFTTRGISQIGNGKYIENSDYFIFKSDSVAFKLKTGGGVVVDLRASGTYEVFDDFLLIKTTKLYNSKTHNVIQKKSEDYVKVSVVDTENKPLSSASIIVFDSSEKQLTGGITDKNGMVLFEKMKSIDKIKVVFLGYESCTFKYSDNYEYKVMLDNERIENQTVVFKINSISGNSIILTWLTSNFKIHRNKENELIELYEKYRNFKRKRNFVKK